MNDLKPFICPNCGGKINRQRMKCEYCGTEFKREEVPLMRIETVQRGVRIAAANVILQDRFLNNFGEEEIMKMVKDEMTYKLAEALVPMLDLEVGRDPERGQAIVRGRIRILEPGYRF